MLSHVIYNRRSDNLALTASSLALGAGTLEAGYELEWVRDERASRPIRLVEKQGAVVFGWDVPVGVALPAIIHPNFEEALPILVQGNATDSWGAPSFSATILQPPWRVDRFPRNPWADLRALEDWDEFLFWRVAVEVDNAVALAIGEIWLGSTVRELQVQWDDRWAHDRPQVEHKTAYRTLRSPLGTTRRSRTGTIPTDDPGAADVVDWVLDADGKPVLVVPRHIETAQPDAWLAIHTVTKQDVQESFENANFLPLGLEEDGRGLEPTPTPLP